MQYSKNTNPHYTASQTPTLPFPSLRCLHCSAQPTTTAQPIQPASHPLTTAPSLATPREHQASPAHQPVNASPTNWPIHASPAHQSHDTSHASPLSCERSDSQ
ncbi:uncharacterized protein LOC123502897 [Portunus trituberculatus]|uniref:uncharacterized protein LOC123502897 n=1 Tax=Portunus trituberculatus TaxID=210409 RepID=UPI001E1CDB9D|nr:uncharacterized protein LOC123502897 [Portunus trituberculatus]